MNKIAEARITLTFGETKIELTMEEAKRLLGELQDLVGPKVNIPRINQIPNEIPFPWDRMPTVIPQREPYRWRGNDPICRKDPRERFATLSNLGFMP